jgi:hypothetical protein
MGDGQPKHLDQETAKADLSGAKCPGESEDLLLHKVWFVCGVNGLQTDPENRGVNDYLVLRRAEKSYDLQESRTLETSYVPVAVS